MSSQLCFRLDSSTNKLLNETARKLRLKRSDLLRMALDRFLSEFSEQPQDRPYLKVKHLVGVFESGISDLGTEHRKHLLARIKRA